MDEKSFLLLFGRFEKNYDAHNPIDQKLGDALEFFQYVVVIT